MCSCFITLFLLWTFLLILSLNPVIAAGLTTCTMQEVSSQRNGVFNPNDKRHICEFKAEACDLAWGISRWGEF